MTPVPGRSRTRATARLRRPVDWARGLVTVVPVRFWLGSAGLGVGQLERARALRGVGMVGAGVHLQLAQHLAAEGALRQHPPDRAADGVLRLAGEQLGVRLLLQAARVAGEAVDLL